MVQSYTCKLDGFNCLHDSDRMIQHAEDAHGVRYKVSENEEERQRSLEAWNKWWNENITIETIQLIKTSTTAEGQGNIQTVDD